MPTTDVVLRPLAKHELGTAVLLRALMNRELNGTDPDVDYPGWRERFVSFFAARLEVERAAIFLAESDSRAIGLASVYFGSNHRTEIFLRPIAYVTSVYVLPERRRRGLATRLTQACIDWARAKGCDVIRLRASKMGRPVYTRMGFTPSDELEIRYD
ncbi:MAG TPA: GNAT family N-acetyltransferase [Candidatus Eremiobacteraceae bacterium]|nr:GNAT family N-acetyltransferase [Candidatus Eremiobacteraceae bacterium]